MSKHVKNSSADGGTTISAIPIRRLSDTPEWSQLLDRTGVAEQSKRDTMSKALDDDSAFFEVINALSHLEYDLYAAPTIQKATISRLHKIHHLDEDISNETSLTIRGTSWGSHCSKEPGYEEHSPYACAGLHILLRDNDDMSLDVQMTVDSDWERYKILSEGLQFVQTPHLLSAERRGLTAMLQEVSTTMALLCPTIVSSQCPCLENLKCLFFLRRLCDFLAKKSMNTNRKSTAEDRWTRAAIGASTWDAVESTTVPIQQEISECWEAGQLALDCTTCQDRHTWAGPTSLINSRTWTLTQPREFEYAAVSYCWDSYKSDKELQADVQLAVKDTPVEYLWIDRFCLSPDELLRQQEIHHMSDIYAKARLVLILPGKEIKELDNLQYDANGTALRVTKENRERIGEQWTRAPWRSRYWTYQEAFMARATAVVTGSAQRPVMSGAALDALATCPDGNVKLTRWHPLDDTVLRNDAHSYHGIQRNGAQFMFHRSHRVCGACGQSESKIARKQPLLTLMGLNWYRQSTRELDTVYSLLAMASEGHRVPVRYDLTIMELYRFLISQKILGAEIMALGAGFVGPRTSWMPKRNHQSHHLKIKNVLPARVWPRGAKVEIDIDERGTLSAAVVPATISASEDGTFLHLNGKATPIKVELEEGSLEVGLEAHVLAPIRLGQSNGAATLVLILSSVVGPGSVRQVRRVEIIEMDWFASAMMFKKGMDYEDITTVRYEL